MQRKGGWGGSASAREGFFDRPLDLDDVGGRRCSVVVLVGLVPRPVCTHDQAPHGSLVRWPLRLNRPRAHFQSPPSSHPPRRYAFSQRRRESSRARHPALGSRARSRQPELHLAPSPYKVGTSSIADFPTACRPSRSPQKMRLMSRVLITRQNHVRPQSSC